MDILHLHFCAKSLRCMVLFTRSKLSLLCWHRVDCILLASNVLAALIYFCAQLIHSCVECLGAVVNNVTHNYTLVKDCFQRFFSESMQCWEINMLHSNKPIADYGYCELSLVHVPNLFFKHYYGRQV
jgi:hypothetical protein